MNPQRSQCLLTEASAPAHGLLARLILPHRIPAGTPARRVEGARIAGENRDLRYRH
jgi:carotenoid cleavage dioxygenase-like enzyme